MSWQRNLIALWFAEFTAIFGFSFGFPFLSIYLHEDLGITDQHELALWTGTAIGIAGLSMAVVSPIWGLLADRYGRRPMLLRSMLGGAVTVGLIGLSQSAIQVVGLRFMQGATSGTVTAANSLVVAETPRDRLGYAIGVLNSAVAIAGALSPLIGGLAVRVFGVRNIFLVAGALLLISVVPVLWVVRERPHRVRSSQRPPTLATIRAAGPGTLRSLVVLLVAQALMQFAFTSTQVLIVLRLIRIDPVHAGTFTGAAFAMAGIGTTIAAIGYSKVGRRTGYLRLSGVAAVLLGVAILGLALAPSAESLIVGLALAGLLYGVLNPSLGSMLGLEAPAQVQSTIFGFNASALAVGSAIGPFATGYVASISDPRYGLLLAAVASISLGVLVRFKGREPVLERPALVSRA